MKRRDATQFAHIPHLYSKKNNKVIIETRQSLLIGYNFNVLPNNLKWEGLKNKRKKAEDKTISKMGKNIIMSR